MLRLKSSRKLELRCAHNVYVHVSGRRVREGRYRARNHQGQHGPRYSQSLHVPYSFLAAVIAAGIITMPQHIVQGSFCGIIDK